MQCGTAGPTKVAVWQQICDNKRKEQSTIRRGSKKNHTIHKEMQVEHSFLKPALTDFLFERRKRKQCVGGRATLKHKDRKRKEKKKET